MKVLMAYASKTGNTKKLFEEVYERIKDQFDVTLTTLKEVNDYSQYDVIIPGFWVDRATAFKGARKFIEQIKDKKVLPMGTLGANPDSEHGERTVVNVSALVDSSCECLGVFLCNGKVDPRLIKKLKVLPVPKALKEKMTQTSLASRAPNEEDFKRGAAFVSSALKKIQ